MNKKIIRRENMRALAKSIGGISKLALKLNKSQSQISHLIGSSPIKNIGDKVAAHTEEAFDKPKGWLDKEHYSIEDNRTVYQTGQGQSAVLCRQVPLITWQEAKEWHQMVNEYQPNHLNQMIATTAKVGPLAFALEVQSDNMESAPGISFPRKSIIVADSEQVATHNSFIVVNAGNDTQASIKQLVTDGNKRYLKPLNPRYPIVEFTVNTVVYGVIKQLFINL